MTQDGGRQGFEVGYDEAGNVQVVETAESKYAPVI